jgi:hypothetical protein
MGQINKDAIVRVRTLHILILTDFDAKIRLLDYYYYYFNVFFIFLGGRH